MSEHNFTDFKQSADTKTFNIKYVFYPMLVWHRRFGRRPAAAAANAKGQAGEPLDPH